MKKCIVCGENPAEVPDRAQMGRPINRVCRECHVKRLHYDLQRIAAYSKNFNEEKETQNCIDQT